MRPERPKFKPYPPRPCLARGLYEAEVEDHLKDLDEYIDKLEARLRDSL